MINKSFPLLLTGTIDVSKSLGGMNKNLAVKSLDERLNQYESAITRYIEESVFNKIVFVETSNYNFDVEKFNALSQKHNKEFEYITFLGSYEKVIEKGKSYGDAEALLYAIKNSKLLKDEETIYKITGRIFLTNSFDIVKGFNKSPNEFISFSRGNRCVTYCFKFNKYDFNKYFANLLDLCDELNGKDLETVFYKIIKDSKIKTKPFKRYPRINGVIGGFGTKYDKKRYQYFIADILIKLGIFTIK